MTDSPVTRSSGSIFTSLPQQVAVAAANGSPFSRRQLQQRHSLQHSGRGGLGSGTSVNSTRGRSDIGAVGSKQTRATTRRSTSRAGAAASTSSASSVSLANSRHASPRPGQPAVSPSLANTSSARKRTRTDRYSDSSAARFNRGQHSHVEASQWVDTSPDTSVMTVSAGLSPVPFINTQYKLAGGLDTPTRITAEGIEALDSSHLDHDFRRRWTTSRSDHDGLGRQTITVNGLERERNGSRKRSRSLMEAEQQQQQRQQLLHSQETWGQFVYNVVGGIAGKMWEFCRGGADAFRGFAAGGGDAYDMGQRTPRRLPNGHLHHDPMATPIPGQFPEDDYLPDEYNETNDQSLYEIKGEDADMRPAKRLHQDVSNEWIFVGDSPRQTADLDNEALLSRPRQSSVSRRSYLPRPSAASPRSGSRPQSSAANASFAGGANSFARSRAASFASPRASPSSRSRRTSSNNQQLSPVEIDVARYTAQRHREERQADASMHKLNQQLQAMIRQGQEALATKFEVEDIDQDGMDEDGVNVDEGYVEGGWGSARRAWAS